MNLSWSCSRCGSRDYGFDERKNVMVCATCGSEVRSEAERNSDLQFFRTVGLAKRHLRVGNWMEAKRLVKPFCSCRPDDKILYLILLAASTKCYSDYHMDNDYERREAFEYWDKLERLHCVNSLMRQYASKRMDHLRAERETVVYKRGISLGLSVLLTFTTIVLFAAGDLSGFIFVIFSIISWTIFIGNVDKWNRILRSLSVNRMDVGSNPFL